MALDEVMVPRDEWPVVERWSREAEVSAAWGLPTAMVSIIPVMPTEMRYHCWISPPDSGWRDCISYLRAMLVVIARWPECPSYIRRTATANEDWTAEQFETIQNAVSLFYTDTFVRTFHRLPVVPVPFRSSDTI